MRILPFILVFAFVAMALPARSLTAASTDTGGSAAVAASNQEVDDNDDSRVEVQLVVLGTAAFVVVVVGLAGYALRKRLGLVPPPPGPDAGGHH